MHQKEKLWTSPVDKISNQLLGKCGMCTLPEILKIKPVKFSSSDQPF
jgi:hypothetical protein